MTYTIKDNNGNTVFSIENVNPEVSYESIDNSLKDLTEYSEKLDKSLEAFNLISNTKAMESFGYRATEGFGDKIKSAGKAMWEKIKEYAKKVISFLVEIFQKIKKIVMAPANKKVLLKAQKMIIEESKTYKDLDKPSIPVIEFIKSEKMNILEDSIRNRFYGTLSEYNGDPKSILSLGGHGTWIDKRDSSNKPETYFDAIGYELKEYKELTDKKDYNFFNKKVKSAINLIGEFNRFLKAVEMNIKIFNQILNDFEDEFNKNANDKDVDENNVSSMNMFKRALDYGSKMQNNSLGFIESCWKSVKVDKNSSDKTDNK